MRSAWWGLVVDLVVILLATLIGTLLTLLTLAVLT